MIDSKLKNGEIERRLGFPDSKDKLPMPYALPAASPLERGPSFRREYVMAKVKEALANPKNLDSSATRPIRRMITPSKQSLGLMRQVSGLGMEDPVFGTKEKGPEHPSNVFDDMSLGDVPEDMLDIVSIASDPTAKQGEGLDIEMFHASLGDLNHSYSEFSPLDVSLVETCTSSSTYERPKQKDRRKKKGLKEANMGKVLEDLHGSAQSLDLEDALFSSPPEQPTLHDSRKTGNSRSTNSKVSCRDQLLMEAALAMQEEGNASKDLVVAALNNSMQDFSLDDMPVSKNRQRVSRGEPQPPPVVPETGRTRPAKVEQLMTARAAKQRTLPSIAALFPLDQDEVASRRSRRMRSRIPCKKKSLGGGKSNVRGWETLDEVSDTQSMLDTERARKSMTTDGGRLEL